MKRRKPGRPAGEPRKSSAFRLPTRLLDALRAAADREGSTATDLLVTAVRPHLSRHKR